MKEATHTHKATNQPLQFIQYIGKTEMEMKDQNGLILTYDQTELEPIFQQKWFIEVRSKNRKTGIYALMDIIEQPYDTKEEAQAAADTCKSEQDKDNAQLCEQHNQRMEAFLMDETTEDTEPTLIQFNYQFTPKEYKHSPFHGFVDIETTKEVHI